MSPALLNLILQLVQLGISEIPDLIAAEQTIVHLLTTGKDPTPEEIEQLDAAHNAIKEKLAAKLAADDNADSGTTAG